MYTIPEPYTKDWLKEFKKALDVNTFKFKKPTWINNPDELSTRKNSLTFAQQGIFDLYINYLLNTI